MLMTNNKLEWSISIPIFRSSIIMKQLGIAIGIPFGILTLILLLAARTEKYAIYALYLLFAVFSLTYLFIWILWGGKYEPAFSIDSSGIRCFTQQKQAKKNSILNSVIVLLGILSSKPSAAGAGLLAQSRQDVLIKWHNIRKVRYNPKKLIITVKGGFAEQIYIFCTDRNYAEVEKLIKSGANFKK